MPAAISPTWLSRKIDAWLTRRNLFVLSFTSNGLGDTVLITALARQIFQRYGAKTIVITKWADLFRHHPAIAGNISIPSLNFVTKPLVKWFIRHVSGERVFRFGYYAGRHVSREIMLADHSRPVSLFQLSTEQLPITVDYQDCRAEIHFSPEEIKAFERRFSALGQYALIKSAGKTTFTTNKEWRVEYFQELVGLLPAVRWVQVGERSDPKLSGCEDLRGATNVRELLWLIRGARFIVATEGFYNHASSAFNTPSFTIFSGFHLPDVARYPNTIPILREPPMACSPCWLERPCPIPNKPCTGDISPQQVARVIAATLADSASEETI